MDADSILKKLFGDTTDFDMAAFDCYARDHFGIIIPIYEEYAGQMKSHCHPAYEIVIDFGRDSDKPMHYWATITSPEVIHKTDFNMHCYRIFIEKEYFESRYLMYAQAVPVFEGKAFEFCSDILKALNTFVFEYSKSMMNSDVTLDSQTEIITHWLIRSIFGETLDMRAVSSDYSLARAQHYIEQHYMENITVEKLAGLGYMSKTTFNRRFKKELGITPIEYLIEVRIKMAKLMLKRKENPVTDIAMRSGFGSSAHFSSCLQKNVGLTPTAYRDRHAD